MQQLYSHHQQQRPQHSHSFKNIGTVRGACSGLWELTNQSRLGLKATGTKMVHSFNTFNIKAFKPILVATQYYSMKLKVSIARAHK